MGGSPSRSPAIRWTPRQQCFASSTILASTLSTVVIWTTPGGSSPERRLTARILKPLLSGARSPKPTGAGSQNTALNRRLVSGGTSPRKQEADQRVNEEWLPGPDKAQSTMLKRLPTPWGRIGDLS